MTHSTEKAYFFKIDTTVKKVRNYLQKQLQIAGIDITVDQWVVIDHLIPSPGISQNNLASATAKDPPTITRILGILIKKGLVERKTATSDRRKQMLFLTEKGRALHQQAFPIVSNMRNKVWENLSETDFEQLVRIIDTIYNNVD